MNDITEFRNPKSLPAAPAKIVAAEIGYILTIPFALIETVISAISNLFTALLPIGQENHAKMYSWLESSSFSIVWAFGNALINPFCNDLIEKESAENERIRHQVETHFLLARVGGLTNYLEAKRRKERCRI